MTNPDAFFDPRLRQAMGEIQKVMDKYGIGGQVDLVSKTHVEFRMFFPKWAPHTWDEKNSRVIWHYRKDDPEGSSFITHYIMCMHEQTMRTFLMVDKFYDWLKEKMKPEVTRGPTVRAPEDLPEPEDEL